MIIGEAFKHLLSFFLLIVFASIGGSAFFSKERGIVLSVLGVVLMVGGAIYLSDKLGALITKWLKKKIEG